MSELTIRLRTLIGFVPVGVERVWRTAAGPSEAWAWLPTAVPWVLAALVAVVGAGISYVTLQIATEFPPLVSAWLAGLGAVLAALAQGLVPERFASLATRMALVVLAGIGGGALGAVASTPLLAIPIVSAGAAGLLIGMLVLARRLAIAGTARSAAEALEPIPVLVSALLVLAALPMLQAGFELIVNQATVTDLVERRVGFSTTLVEVRGYALRLPLEAEPPSDPGRADPHGFTWIPIRDDLQSRQVVLIRSPDRPADLTTRGVLARVTTDAEAVAAAATAFATRGAPDHGLAGQHRVLVELTPEAALDASGVRELGSADELAAGDDGTLVRLTLTFRGVGVATCAPTATCNARRLASGIGTWEQLAHPADGEATAATGVVVRTPYPPSVAPVRIFGRQVADRGAVERFVALPWVEPLVGWAQVLRAALIERDPSLPVDRLWLGPVLFAAAAGLLLTGRRIGYPIFSIQAVTAGSTPPTPAGSVRAVASGRIAPSGAHPVEMAQTPIIVRDTGRRVEIEIPGRTTRGPVSMPYVRGSLSGVVIGELRYVRRREPALRASWYGSQALLVFASDADRDRAAWLVTGATAQGLDSSAPSAHDEVGGDHR